MSITFELPGDVERSLRDRFGDLSQAAKEAFLIQTYREGRLSCGQLARILGKGVLETYTWLQERGAPLNYSLKDFDDDCASLAEKFPEIDR